MVRIGIHSENNNIKDYLRALSKTDGFEFNGLYTTDASILLSGRIKHFGNLDEFLKQNDAILFINYQKSHYKNLLKAVKFSKHILFYDIAELKPEHAHELKKIAEEANVVFKIEVNNSFLTGIKSEKANFENPALLETIIEIKQTKNQIIDTFISEYLAEYIYQILLLVKGNVKRVVAKSVSIFNKHNDVANINLEFDNGSIATICINTIATKNIYKITFYNHHFIASVDLINKKIKSLNSIENTKTRKKIVKKTTSKIIELSEFLETINNKPAISPSLEYGIKALEIIHRIQDKLRISSNGIE